MMNKFRFFLSIFLITITFTLNAQNKKSYKVNTVAFYNVENLFSLEDDEFTVYHDRTPRADAYYTREVYNAKLRNLARVISEIGADVTGTTPALVGLCEVENREVIQDLINQDALRSSNYGIIHYNSPDRRGIDVALIYKKDVFVPTNTKSVELKIFQNNDPTQRRYTRDQLVVSGLLDGDLIHLIVNHWPARSGGEARSRPHRIQAAELNMKIIDSLHSIDPYAKIITIGDYNDDPTSPSIKRVLNPKSKREDVKTKDLFNPFEDMHRRGLGSLAWRDGWNLFDQAILSAGFLTGDFSGYQFFRAGIYNPAYLANPRGRFKGYPFRSYADGGFTGGYSDHFPVYVLLVKEAE